MKKSCLILLMTLALLLCSCGHTHEYIESVVPPGCTEDGYTEYTCACGETYRDAAVAGGHQVEILAAQKPTCTNDGLTQGKKCSVCGEMLVEQTPVAAEGHQYDEGLVIKEASYTEAGILEKECGVCGDRITEEIPVKQAIYVVYDLNGAEAVVPYESFVALGDAFLSDFNQYGGVKATKENFQGDSTAAVKTALGSREMLEKWDWLWTYMLAHLQAENAGESSAYIKDTYPILERMIQGDTTAILESANARTSIRSYLHGMLNATKGCGALNAEFSSFSPDFSVAAVQENLMKYDIAVTMEENTALLVLIREGYTFVGWQNADGEAVTQATVSGTLTAAWEALPKKEHTPTALPAKEASCEEPGLTAGEVCSQCGEILVAQQSVPALGHSFGEWAVVKESTLTEVGQSVRTCAACGATETQELPLLQPSEYTVTYDLAGGAFADGYASTEELAQAFLEDFNRYGDGSVVTREKFQTESHPCVKTTLTHAEMLAKWSWLWEYMLAHLKSINPSETSAYLTDTYPILERMIAGDTTAALESANARTTIRSYLHGLLNSMKGCGDFNATFAAFSPDFSQPEEQAELLKHQYELQAVLANGETLPVPVRRGYTFVGWKNEQGEIIHHASCDGALLAVWEESTPVERVEITNKVAEISLFETYALTWEVFPQDAGNPEVRFESSDPTVADVDQSGVITAHTTGEVTIRIISLSREEHTDQMTVQVVSPEYFEISYESESYVFMGEQIKLNAVYINRDHQACEVLWSSLDETLATVDEAGCVTGLAAGVVSIRATVPGKDDCYQDFIVTVLEPDVSGALQLVLDAHESNVYTKYDLPVGAGTPAYYADIFGSVSQLLYNHELEIDDTYNQQSNDKYAGQLDSMVMESIEFITVHYTGSFGVTANALAHIKWFALPEEENETSIHYCTGNDGVYKGLDEQYLGAHAGDGRSRETVAKFAWIDTPVQVLESDPEFPVVTITADATFAINGRDTGIRVPEETKFGRGYVTDTKWLNEQGLGVNIKDGYYQLGTCWWCYTQVAEGRICSNGGNYNSIGIESAVNKGSDLWYTWQITAQLVADIMVRHDLDITRVKGHHFYSAKNCPQPMLENDLEIWWEFIELVKCEYEKITTCQDYTFAFSCDSELVNEQGRVTGQSDRPQIVSYRVTVTKDGQTEEIVLASVIEGAYNK